MNPRGSADRRAAGVVLAIGAALVSGVAVFVNAYGVQHATKAGVDGTSYTTAKNLIAALVLIGVAGIARAARSTAAARRPSTGTEWMGLAAVGVLGGGIAFALFFEGLTRITSETPVKAQLLHKTLVVWVAILAVVFLRERINGFHIGAIALLVLGQVRLAGGTGGFTWGSGEWMIVGATAIWSVETVVAKKLLGSLPELTVALARMIGGSVVLLGWVALTGHLDRLAWDSSWWGWALSTGVILAVYVGVWFAALARAQAVDVTAVLVGAVLVTMLLDRAASHPVLQPAAGYWLVLGGFALALVAALLPRRRLAAT
ncbi:MAG: DMT family transporter [Acidimicrobiia bacterium]